LTVAHNFGVVSSEGIRIPVPRRQPHTGTTRPQGDNSPPWGLLARPPPV